MRYAWLLLVLLAGCQPAEVRIGSKHQPESIILGDMMTLLARHAGAQAAHRAALGGTRVLWNALLAGEIDAYVEYTGTLTGEILANEKIAGPADLRQALLARGIEMSEPIGFNDTYALGMREERAAQLGINSISDLRAHPQLRLGFSSEFLDRADGWPGLRTRYRLPQTDVRGLNHELAYQGLVSGTIDLTDLYSTDAKIRRFHLRTLADDAHYFPAYQAVLVYREDLAARAPRVVAEMRRLEGQISEGEMISLNARVELDREPEALVAADFLSRQFQIQFDVSVETVGRRLWRLTKEHLALTGVSLAAAVLLAVPLGIVAQRRPRLGRWVLAATGTMQTIPSMALLMFMIPILGIGAPPAIAALFLYSLLPIVQNTYAGLQQIPMGIRESASALGLPPAARLRLVELPLAAPTILAGIKTAAIINVGTATLGGFIGAGGYGEAIFRGIPKMDVGLVLQGAIPAAVLALLVQGLFDLAERYMVPKGLRL